MIDLFKPKDKGRSIDYIKLMIFAYIYSYSRDGKSKWYGKQQTLANIIGCGEKAMYQKLKELVDENLLVKEEVQLYGMFHHNNYWVNLENTSIFQENTEVFQENTTVFQENTNYKSNNKSINNSLYIDEEDIKKDDINNQCIKEKKRFIPPTLREVIDYVNEKHYSVDPNVFYDYFNETNWIDSKGKKVKNWKAKLITWNSYNSGGTYNRKPKNNSNILKPEVTMEDAKKYNELV